jgi:hypothetical protein
MTPRTQRRKRARKVNHHVTSKDDRTPQVFEFDKEVMYMYTYRPKVPRARDAYMTFTSKEIGDDDSSQDMYGPADNVPVSALDGCVVNAIGGMILDTMSEFTCEKQTGNSPRYGSIRKQVGRRSRSFQKRRYFETTKQRGRDDEHSLDQSTLKHSQEMASDDGVLDPLEGECDQGQFDFFNDEDSSIVQPGKVDILPSSDETSSTMKRRRSDSSVDDNKFQPLIPNSLRTPSGSEGDQILEHHHRLFTSSVATCPASSVRDESKAPDPPASGEREHMGSPEKAHLFESLNVRDASQISELESRMSAPNVQQSSGLNASINEHEDTTDFIEQPAKAPSPRELEEAENYLEKVSKSPSPKPLHETRTFLDHVLPCPCPARNYIPTPPASVSQPNIPGESLIRSPHNHRLNQQEVNQTCNQQTGDDDLSKQRRLCPSPEAPIRLRVSPRGSQRLPQGGILVEHNHQRQQDSMLVRQSKLPMGGPEHFASRNDSLSLLVPRSPPCLNHETLAGDTVEPVSEQARVSLPDVSDDSFTPTSISRSNEQALKPESLNVKKQASSAGLFQSLKALSKDEEAYNRLGVGPSIQSPENPVPISDQSASKNCNQHSQSAVPQRPSGEKCAIGTKENPLAVFDREADLLVPELLTMNEAFLQHPILSQACKSGIVLLQPNINIFTGSSATRQQDTGAAVEIFERDSPAKGKSDTMETPHLTQPSPSHRTVIRIEDISPQYTQCHTKGVSSVAEVKELNKSESAHDCVSAFNGNVTDAAQQGSVERSSVQKELDIMTTSVRLLEERIAKVDGALSRAFESVTEINDNKQRPQRFTFDIMGSFVDDDDDGLDGELIKLVESERLLRKELEEAQSNRIERRKNALTQASIESYEKSTSASTCSTNNTNSSSSGAWEIEESSSGMSHCSASSVESVEPADTELPFAVLHSRLQEDVEMLYLDESTLFMDGCVDEIEVVLVEEEPVAQDYFRYGESKGLVFDWIQTEPSTVSGNTRKQAIKAASNSVSLVNLTNSPIVVDDKEIISLLDVDENLEMLAQLPRPSRWEHRDVIMQQRNQNIFRNRDERMHDRANSVHVASHYNLYSSGSQPTLDPDERETVNNYGRTGFRQSDAMEETTSESSVRSGLECDAHSVDLKRRVDAFVEKSMNMSVDAPTELSIVLYSKTEDSTAVPKRFDDSVALQHEIGFAKIGGAVDLKERLKNVVARRNASSSFERNIDSTSSTHEASCLTSFGETSTAPEFAGARRRHSQNKAEVVKASNLPNVQQTLAMHQSLTKRVNSLVPPRQNANSIANAVRAPMSSSPTRFSTALRRKALNFASKWSKHTITTSNKHSKLIRSNPVEEIIDLTSPTELDNRGSRQVSSNFVPLYDTRLEKTLQCTQLPKQNQFSEDGTTIPPENAMKTMMSFEFPDELWQNGKDALGAIVVLAPSDESPHFPDLIEQRDSDASCRQEVARSQQGRVAGRATFFSRT